MFCLFRLLAISIVFLLGYELSNLKADPGVRQWATGIASVICKIGINNPTLLASTLGVGTKQLKGRQDKHFANKKRLHLYHRNFGEIVIYKKNDKTRKEITQIQINLPIETGFRPHLMIRQNSVCQTILARELRYQSDGRMKYLIHLDKLLEKIVLREPLNPPVPAWHETGNSRVAHVDSGVNYLLPKIFKRLARDKKGNLIGWDFWDNDHRPFDLNPIQSPFFPMRHGTAVASVFLREAPNASLMPFRYPGNDMSKFSLVIDAIANTKVGIVMMPIGSDNAKLWKTFKNKVVQFPEILFIISAGNDGRDIDKKPIYPASFNLKNIVVVTSSDNFGRLANGSNWGEKNIDLMTPGERITVTDHRGVEQKASGSSYAVPRIAALAVRLKERHPEWSAEKIKKAIFSLATDPRMRGRKGVRVGWIPNPLDDD